MASWHQHTALIVNGEEFSLADLLRHAKWREQLAFVQAAADAALIRQSAVERGIAVTDEELRQAAKDFRSARQLYAGAELRRWLAGRSLTLSDWELMLEDDLLRRKLRNALTGAQVEQYFAENRLSFNSATISHLVTREQDVAKEMRMQIVQENVDFHKLARRYSIDEATRPASGYLGRVRRADLDPISAAAVFGAEAGKVVGPLKSDEGWRLIRVHALHPATLDDETRENIQSLLFEEWLAERRGRARISAPLLEDEDTAEGGSST